MHENSNLSINNYADVLPWAVLKGKHIIPKIYLMGITVLDPKPSVRYWRFLLRVGNGTNELSVDAADIKSECMVVC